MMRKMKTSEIDQLKRRIEELEAENMALKKAKDNVENKRVVAIPPPLKPIFDKAEELVSNYFSKLKMDPPSASIMIDDERYVLMRASSLSIDFLNKIKGLYSDKGDDEAIRIGQNFLFDISHVIGLEDARTFHKKMNLTDPVSKLSAGPVHFAYSGWATVEIIEGNPSPDENFFLKYKHPHSFEVESWIQNNNKSDRPVCIMNAGYSSGWCEESFSIPLTAIETSCRAKGDDSCSFIMAHPIRISEHLKKSATDIPDESHQDIPQFFERKIIEQELIKSIEEKSILLKEIHHRVKNNLQLISSLLNLQSHHLNDQVYIEMFDENKNRIKAIALVHEKLYQSSDVEHVNLKEYLQSIIDLLSDSIGMDHIIEMDISSVVNNRIPIDTALPCGLIFSELISNAIKYAFPANFETEHQQILIQIEESDQHYQIAVKDNGIGLPDNFSIEQTDSLGFEIVSSLVEQLNGKIWFNSGSDSETSVFFSFDV